MNRIPATYGYSSDTLFFSIVVSSLSIHHHSSSDVVCSPIRGGGRKNPFWPLTDRPTDSSLPPPPQFCFCLATLTTGWQASKQAGTVTSISLTRSLQARFSSLSRFCFLSLSLSLLYIQLKHWHSFPLSLSPVWSPSQVSKSDSHLVVFSLSPFFLLQLKLKTELNWVSVSVSSVKSRTSISTTAAKTSAAAVPALAVLSLCRLHVNICPPSSGHFFFSFSFSFIRLLLPLLLSPRSCNYHPNSFGTSSTSSLLLLTWAHSHHHHSHHHHRKHTFQLVLCF